MSYTIETTKGGTTGTLVACLEWQAERQGAAAVIVLPSGERVDVSGVDFDPDALAGAYAAVRAAIVAETLPVGTNIIAGRGQDREGGRVVDVDGTRVRVAWEQGTTTWQSREALADLEVVG